MSNETKIPRDVLTIIIQLDKIDVKRLDELTTAMQVKRVEVIRLSVSKFLEQYYDKIIADCAKSEQMQ